MSSLRLPSLEVIEPISDPGVNIVTDKDTIVIPNYNNEKQSGRKILGVKNSKKKIVKKRKIKRKESIKIPEKEIIVVSSDSDSDSEKTETNAENENKSEGLQKGYEIVNLYDYFPIITGKQNYLKKKDIFLNDTDGSNYVAVSNFLKSVNTDERLIKKYQHLINTNRERWATTNQMCVDATYRSVRCNIEGKTPVFYSLLFSKYLLKFIWLKIPTKFINQKIQHYLMIKYYQDNAIHVLSSLKMKNYNN